jgi:membrane protease subunit (stomatin/prohibitin family)
MGLMNLFRGELIEIIEWIDDSRDTLAWRFPDDDRAIKNGAQLIVRESQVAQLVMTGQFADSFWPGKHTLSTPNVPVLARIQGWKYGFVSPFKVDIYFVSTRLFTGNKWGTSNPVMMRDQDFGVIRLRAFGTFDFKVSTLSSFLKKSSGRTRISGSTSSPTRCAHAW